MLTVRKRISANLNDDASADKNIFKGRYFMPRIRRWQSLRNLAESELFHLEHFVNGSFVTRAIDLQLNEEVIIKTVHILKHLEREGK